MKYPNHVREGNRGSNKRVTLEDHHIILDLMANGEIEILPVSIDASPVGTSKRQVLVLFECGGTASRGLFNMDLAIILFSQ